MGDPWELPEPGWLNVGCGTHNAPAPWWNVDVVYAPEHSTTPDDVVPRGPLPYADGSATRVLLSHVLEHQPWPAALPFLEDVRRVLAPGGEVFAIGPDYVRTLRMWKEGRCEWDLAEAVLEHARGRQDIDGPWTEARHHWNCSEDRMLLLLREAGFDDVKPVPVPGATLDGLLADRWAVWGPAEWQCAAWAVAP